MRELTDAEAQAICAQLGPPHSERERIREAGLPRRTFQEARRRALSEGWLVERLLPNPVAFGRTRLTLALVVDDGGTLALSTARRWNQSPGTVHLWLGARTLLGIFLEPGRAEAGPGSARESIVEGAPVGSISLEIDLRGAHLPVYFDFEGAWSRVVGRTGPSYYPRALPDWAGRPASSTRAPNPTWSRRVQELVTRAATTPPGGPSLWGSGVPSGRIWLRRAMEEGWVEARSFLNLGALPGYLGWKLREVVYVHGDLQSSARPERLFQSLVGECGALPFLFATDDRRVLLALLAPAPSRQAPGRPRGSVGRTLEQFLGRVASFRESAQGLQPLLNHRYERIFGGDGPRAEPSSVAGSSSAAASR